MINISHEGEPLKLPALSRHFKHMNFKERYFPLLRKLAELLSEDDRGEHSEEFKLKVAEALSKPQKFDSNELEKRKESLEKEAEQQKKEKDEFVKSVFGQYDEFTSQVGNGYVINGYLLCEEINLPTAFTDENLFFLDSSSREAALKSFKEFAEKHPDPKKITYPFSYTVKNNYLIT